MDPHLFVAKFLLCQLIRRGLYLVTAFDPTQLLYYIGSTTAVLVGGLLIHLHTTPSSATGLDYSLDCGLKLLLLTAQH